MVGICSGHFRFARHLPRLRPLADPPRRPYEPGRGVEEGIGVRYKSMMIIK